MPTAHPFCEEKFRESIFSGQSFEFEQKAVELFQFQHQHNEVYQNYCQLINCQPEKVNSLQGIPFLPISMFKSQEVKTTHFTPEFIFSSSGTSGQQTSKHAVKDISLYERSFTKGFEQFYGNLEEYCILGLLPSYLEREGSSLIYMVDRFIRKSTHRSSGFFLNNREELYQILIQLQKTKQKTLLIGVSFALLDFADQFQLSHNENLIVMETGGMKGRRKELVREELHQKLQQAFSTPTIHSEYGMTELLSQAYSKGKGSFITPPWMKVVIRAQDDPFHLVEVGKLGAINVVDLANIHSCAFIQTDDLGRKQTNQSFEILGRFDSSDVRGCNLMVV